MRIKKYIKLSLEKWYEKGFWNDKTIPYTLFDGQKAAANILVIQYEFSMEGKTKKYIQLSTVMTDKEYRKQGLLRFLMEKVLKDWKGNCDGMYLYANDSVLDFYPKFGFRKENEFQRILPLTGKNFAMRKLDMSNQDDFNRLLGLCRQPNPFSRIDMSKNYELVMFHAMMDKKDHIYYLEEYNIIVLAKQQEKTLICYDIYGYTDVSLTEILSKVADFSCERAQLLFTPKNPETGVTSVYEEEDTTLFVLGERDTIFAEDKVILPLTYRA
ncbi:GNAT family N-acetyltransferase [Anaerocolumna sedimenticola]|uniref:GNAT family N-acetyltransferase n=1 Tax=Anaerocolumna sedimenticola TaxID=2696063 RepID=A0A6P1TKP7_9FIRM|nr:GNAT family N-acetyltransferase [Anaerocolumna sedimenticola]QHQ60867.1 GNAT family N-acetyltransferase [Anaerocolumna sedimenticola]